MKKCFYLFWILGIVSIQARAQQGITYNQYSKNQTAINSASSFLKEGGELFVVGRRQWAGMDGAPTAFWGSLALPVGDFGANMGVNIRHERLAIEKTSEISAFFAKSIQISRVEYVAVSINAGLTYYDGRFSSIDPSDPAFRNDIRDTDVLTGFGVMLYRPEYYYIGLSLPRLMFSKLGIGGQKQYDFSNQYYLTGGALFELASDLHVRPAFVVSYAENLRPQAEISTMLFVSRMIGVGANYRTYGDLSGMLQLNINRIGLGYSYQFNVNDKTLNRRISNTTHEIGLSYRFGQSPVGLL